MYNYSKNKIYIYIFQLYCLKNHLVFIISTNMTPHLYFCFNFYRLYLANYIFFNRFNFMLIFIQVFFMKDKL